MKRIEIEQDTSEWLDFKRTKIGGSGAKNTAVPLKTGKDRTPAGFWDLVANKLTTPLDGSEAPTDRGHRLEVEVAEELKELLGVEFESKPTVWVSEQDEDLILSSDACEPVEVPTYDAEIKAFSKLGKHFKLLYQLNEGDDGIDLLNMGYGSDFRTQILHGFVVNPKLKTRYFASYCPEAIYQKHKLAIVKIDREDYEDEIQELMSQELSTLENVRDIVSELTGDDF